MALEQKLENVQKLVMNLPTCTGNHELRNSLKKKERGTEKENWNSVNMSNIIRAPCSVTSSRKSMEKETENRSPESNSVGLGLNASLRQNNTPNSEETCSISSRGNVSSKKQSNSINVKKMQRMFQKATEDNIQSIKTYVTELKERVAKLQYQKQLLVCQVRSSLQHIQVHSLQKLACVWKYECLKS